MTTSGVLHQVTRQIAFFGASSDLDIQELDPFVEQTLHLDQDSVDGASGFRKRRFGILRRHNKLLDVGRPLGDNQTELGKMTTQGVDDLRALTHQCIACPKHHRCGLRHLALHRHERIAGRWTASQIASASAASFFCRFTNGLT